MSDEGIPPEIKAALAALLIPEILKHGKVHAIEVHAENASGPIRPPEGQSETPERRPATVDEAARLAAPEPMFKVGERVRWKKGMQHADWPEADQVVVVSQVIDPPLYKLTKLSTSEGAERHDFGVAFVDTARDGENGLRGEVVGEFLYDSRRFERVNE